MKFSEIEKQHLLKSWVAISFAFSVLYRSIFSPDFIIFFVISLLTVGLGFLLHEIGHKLVAQKYGCWAEFRADDRMLMFAVIAAFFFGFVFAASWIVWSIIKVTMGIRVTAEEEEAGMDLHDCGLEAYPEFTANYK